MLSSRKELPKPEVRIITRYDDQVPDFFQTFHCSPGNVKDVLAPEVDYWTPRNPTLISAPTGMGKTTLACEEILPRAIAKRKNVLIVLNRVGLATQLKLKVMEKVAPSLIECLTEKGIRAREYIGNVCIITYHRLPAFIHDPSNQNWIKDLMYVVADEIHVITSDSAFNEKCGYYLKLLTTYFQHAVRVYMTATEWDVLVPLAEAEEKNYMDIQRLCLNSWQPPRQFRRYVFPADYSHVNLHFFKDLDGIIEKINNDRSQKWILFMASKKAGKELAKQLGNRAVYLDADSKESAEWYQLLKQKCFSQQVLITTAVLDCGVNVVDPKLRNIVIFTDSRASLIQMLGRKRCRDGEHVNLFVHDIDENTIAKRYNDGICLCHWLDRYEEGTWEVRNKMMYEIWHSRDESLMHYFDLADGHLVPNHIAFFFLKRKMNFYRSILNGKVTFQQQVRSWLGFPDESELVEENMDLEARLLSFCEDHLNQDMANEEVVQFRDMVIRIADQVGSVKTRADRLESIGRDALNKRLETFMCPYRLARGTWKIVKTAEALL